MSVGINIKPSSRQQVNVQSDRCEVKQTAHEHLACFTHTKQILVWLHLWSTTRVWVNVMPQYLMKCYKEEEFQKAAVCKCLWNRFYNPFWTHGLAFFCFPHRCLYQGWVTHSQSSRFPTDWNRWYLLSLRWHESSSWVEQIWENVVIPTRVGAVSELPAPTYICDVI